MMEYRNKKQKKDKDNKIDIKDINGIQNYWLCILYTLKT